MLLTMLRGRVNIQLFVGSNVDRNPRVFNDCLGKCRLKVQKLIELKVYSCLVGDIQENFAAN